MTATLNGGSDPVGRVTVAKCTALLTVEWDRAGTVVVTHPETAATSSHSFFDKRTPEKFHHFPSSSGNRHFLKNRADAVRHLCQKLSSRKYSFNEKTSGCIFPECADNKVAVFNVPGEQLCLNLIKIFVLSLQLQLSIVEIQAEDSVSCAR